MENAKKYLMAGYISTVISMGILFYLSHINSEFISIFSVIFILVISVLFFYGFSFLKEEKATLVVENKEEDFLEKDFLVQLNQSSLELSNNIFKKIGVFFQNIGKAIAKWWREKVIPFLREQNTAVSLDLTPEGQNILVAPEKLLLDLKNYLYQVYVQKPEIFKEMEIPLPRNIRLH